MNKHIAILVFVLVTGSLFSPCQVSAQAPDKISYQAVIRNSNGELVTNQTIGMQVLIIQGKILGGAVYRENHTPVTNANGLVSIEIGGGEITFGNLSTLDWLNGPYFIRTDIDINGGTNYSITGTTQILSVPYALHAKKAETLEGGLLWSSNANDIYYNKGNVGIGINKPLANLHVIGTGLFEGYSKIHIGNNRIFFSDFGEIASYDDKHKIVFRRDINILEFREYGDIVFSSGATQGIPTYQMVLKNNGHLELKNKNIRYLADPINPQDAATKAYVDALKDIIHDKLDPVPGDIVFSGAFSENFNSNAWRNAWGIYWDNRAQDCTIVPYGFYGTHSLRVKYPAGGVGPTVTETHKIASGAQFPMEFWRMASVTESHYNELTLRYYLKFEHGFDFKLGGKLPGLMGGGESWSRSGGNQPDGTNGWTLRFMWGEKGYITVYAYVPPSGNGKWGSEQWGQNIDCDFFAEPGKWHCIEQYVNVGTPGNDDGKLKIWIDGVKKLDIDDMRFRNIENDHGRIGGIYFSTFHGGNSDAWAPLNDSYTQFANFAVFKKIK